MEFKNKPPLGICDTKDCNNLAYKEHSGLHIILCDNCYKLLTGKMKSKY